MRCYLAGAAVGAADPRSCHLVRVCHAVSDGMKTADARFPADTNDHFLSDAFAAFWEMFEVGSVFV